VLHDVETPVSERQRQELASAHDVVRAGRRGNELGRESPWLACDGGQNDPEDQATIFLVWVGKWSDGTPAPLIVH
jgi:hypothetical protein